MILPADALFRRQRDEHALRMHCEDCVLFDDVREQCAHGYPTEAHRRPPNDDAPITFCKDFEAL
ncbi:MAG: hypothetical protein J0L92_37770 [Deltaproteobacteria bacterium]|nr:hypothetical protein [Deltaproteobacteria bacterium]